MPNRQYEYIHLAGRTTLTVLINGESGTGKEYIARLIHSMSNRKDGPFVAVDCGAIPKGLLPASEFFGHIKGSFTGAVTDKQGYFVIRIGGYNISWMRLVICLMTWELSCCAHSKSERCIRWVGMLIFLLMFVLFQRLNEHLKEAVASGRFREDLYHRLNEFSIQALPLRERKEDILIFANHFLDKANEELGKQVAGFDEEVMRIFRAYSWPGNLREMRNIVKRATLLCMGSLISKTCLPPELEQKPVEPEKTSTTRREMEIELIKDAMQKCRNNKSEAARMLQIDRKTLYNKLKSFGLEDL